jgi:hypothetical protein
VLVDQIPQEDEAVVCAGGEDTPSVGGPFDGADGCGVAFEFEDGLARLPDIEHADDAGVLRKCC